MNADLLGTVLSSLLGGRRKKASKALRLVNANTVLTAAGLAWGIYESLQQGTPAPAPQRSPVEPAAAPPLPVTADEATLRLLRLAVAAANADGRLSAAERAVIAEQARASGASASLASALEQPVALAEIVAGARSQAERSALYVLAYTIVRADEDVSGTERIFLAQLAHQLGLDPAAVQALERETGSRIDNQQP